MFVPGPIFKESALFAAEERSANTHADVSSNIYHMRQLSVASVLSISKDYMYYKLHVINVGEEVSVDAMLTHHPNHWNIVGYPAVGDMVLIMHQRQFNDAHIIMRLQAKDKPILDHTTVANNDGIPTGVLMP